MPANARNSKGIRSMNELFAMKKNQAFESKLTQRVSAMSRDFYGRRETLKQDIRSVYEDLQEIRLSTGYSLDNVS
ncbi:hypothetical protein DPMN_045749 [Dreissena polymorpha]|uniref:Uncharacterized protein n=1 Tax=Dreissena polymorpha TaxID=45954 RepID=A0A9D4I075_DREPO|nr:hypothetical protein DPMN_045749 [Dreissena polymorpha]